MQLLKELASSGNLIRIRGHVKPRTPFHQIQTEPGLDVERTLWVTHPSEPLGDHPRLCKRCKVARDNHARIAKRAVLDVRGIAIQDCYIKTSTKGRKGRR